MSNKRLRISALIIQPVLVWDDGEELTPFEQQVQPVTIPLSALAQFTEKAKQDVKKLEEQLQKNQFESDYCKESDITLEVYHQNFVTLPCSCGESSCNGWASVSNNESSIRAHKTLQPSLNC